MVPGDLGETGFEDWPGDPSDWKPRAVGELERFDWQPMGASFGCAWPATVEPEVARSCRR